MSASSPMRTLVRIGHCPHPIDRKRYGAPRLALYWARPRLGFAKPGLYLWAFGRQKRVLPVRNGGSGRA